MAEEKNGKSGKKVKIIIDIRERAMKTFLKRYDCIFEEKQLPVGDFVLSDRAVAERKTVKDFVQSVSDGRLFNQLIMLKQVQRPILIIEGMDINSHNRDIQPNAIRGALASVVIDYQIPILWARNIEETAALLYQIAKREQLKKKRPISIRVKHRFRSLREQQEFLVCGLPLVSTVLARRLLDKFGSPEAVFNASEEDLQKVKGIGKELAAKIKNVLETKFKTDK